MDKLKAFVKKEAVLCIAAACAGATMLLVPPDGAYPGYIDLRVLCLLFCLMAVVAGFQSCGLFGWFTCQLLRRVKSGRALGVTLVLLPFFSSMLVTNDVALLVFVPFTLALLAQVNGGFAVIPMMVLQTIAANLGSMATPVGNPQNLFLYAAYELSPGAFFGVVLPLAGISLVCLAAAGVMISPAQLPPLTVQDAPLHQPKKLTVWGVLFVLCLLTVFRVVPYQLMTLAVLAAVWVLETRILKGLDWALLATFVCFFIVSGNLGRVEEVRQFLQALLGHSALFTAVGTSQIISNVPAAVLLSGFTGEWQALLAGVNIGGLGTPIASLASLITLKQYLRWPGAAAGRFLSLFTVMNLAGLAVLLSAAVLLF